MFIKPIKVKSKILLRSSDRKKLQVKLAGKYPKLTEENFGKIFTQSGNIHHVKVITAQEEIVWVYLVEKQPVFFELVNGSIYPTIHTLWIVPDLLASVTTNPSVLPILAKGANLMARGVIRQNQQGWTGINRGETVAVNLTTNTNACAVGIYAQSSNDLHLNGGTGVCVEILHVFGDKLWSIEPGACVQIPVGSRVLPELKSSDFPALGAPGSEKMSHPVKSAEAPAAPADDLSEKLDEVELAEDPIEEESPDEVIKKAFLTALKKDKEKLVLPLLTSTFYANHVQAVTPINIKQTSYKKVTKFLQEMSNEGFLVVREEKKGVEKIISIDYEHPQLMAFRPDQASGTKADAAKEEAPKPIQLLTSMTKIFSITEATSPFFTHFSKTTGQGLMESEVEKCFATYVRKNKLQNKENPRQVCLDDTLAKVLEREVNSLENYSTLLQEIFQKMPTNFEMRAKDKSDNLPNIQISLATRSGNKKVTLISNLEAHGIFIPDFSNRCKVGVQASTTVTQTPAFKGDQLLVQGNHVRFVHNLLTDTYKVPPRKISGLELARKEPKKKKK
ncbi:Eukaryotic translation initiation factor 2D [Sergentomyia squamirostris]